MPRAPGKKATKKKTKAAKVSSGAKGRPRTVRLPHADEIWVDEQAHPQGFTGVISDAVRLYREHKDDQSRVLLEAVS